jgi:hypothetical protein
MLTATVIAAARLFRLKHMDPPLKFQENEAELEVQPFGQTGKS